MLAGGSDSRFGAATWYLLADVPVIQLERLSVDLRAPSVLYYLPRKSNNPFWRPRGVEVDSLGQFIQLIIRPEIIRLSDLLFFVLVFFVLCWGFFNNCHKKVFVVAQQDVWKCIMETTGTALCGCRRWREVAGDGDERISGASCRLAGGRSWGRTALANRNAALRPGRTVLSKCNALHRSPQLDVLNMHLEPANTLLANWRFFLCFVQMLLIPLNFQMATSSKKKTWPKTFKLIYKIWITSLVWNMFFYANNKNTSCV